MPTPEIPTEYQKQQLYELKRQFYECTDSLRRHRSAIEDKVALAHINFILDTYIELRLDIAWEQQNRVGYESA